MLFFMYCVMLLHYKKISASPGICITGKHLVRSTRPLVDTCFQCLTREYYLHSVIPVLNESKKRGRVYFISGSLSVEDIVYRCRDGNKCTLVDVGDHSYCSTVQNTPTLREQFSMKTSFFSSADRSKNFLAHSRVVSWSLRGMPWPTMLKNP